MPNQTPEPPRVTGGQIAEWDAVTNAATEGPWEHAEDSNYDDEGHEGSIKCVGDRAFYIAKMEPDGPLPAEDARFIATARTAMPALIAEVKRLKAELAELRGNATLAEMQRATRRNQARAPRTTERL